MTCGKGYSDPPYLNAETIPLAGILVPRRIELKVNYVIRKERKTGRYVLHRSASLCSPF